jgi:hypothetical protein
LCVKNATRDSNAEIKPHAKQAQPGEHLHGGKLLHRRGHSGNRLTNLPYMIADAMLFGFHAPKSFHVFRRILLRRQDCPQDRAKECRRSHVE